MWREIVLRFIQRIGRFLIALLKTLGELLPLFGIFLHVFAVAGVELFGGSFYFCLGRDVRNISNKSDCLLAQYEWVNSENNFDDFFQALMTLLTMLKGGFFEILYRGVAAVGVDQQPKPDHNPWAQIYFCSFFLIYVAFWRTLYVEVLNKMFPVPRAARGEGARGRMRRGVEGGTLAIASGDMNVEVWRHRI